MVSKKYINKNERKRKGKLFINVGSKRSPNPKI